MHFQKLFFLWACLATCALANEMKAPFSPGETSSYEVSFLGIPMGEAQIMIGAAMQQEKQLVWPVILVGRTKPLQPYQINDKLVTYWNQETQTSAGLDLFIDENKKRRREKIKFDRQNHTALVVRQKEGEPANSKSYQIAQQTMDVAAASLFLRNQPLQAGETFEIPVFTGKKTFNLKANVAEKHRIQTQLGEKEAFLVLVRPEFEGNLAAKRDIRIFVSADGKHVPLLIEADLVLGRLVAEIVRYEPGKATPSSSSK